jgi:hypothetical protein
MKRRVRTTRTAKPAGSAEARVIRNPLVQLVADADCTMDAISRRACHVGPTMEGILHEMEDHWMDNQQRDV